MPAQSHGKEAAFIFGVSPFLLCSSLFYALSPPSSLRLSRSSYTFSSLPGIPIMDLSSLSGRLEIIWITCVHVYIWLHHWIKLSFLIKRTLEKKISPHFLNISVAKNLFRKQSVLVMFTYIMGQMTNEIIMEHLFITSTEMENQNSLE